MSLFTAKQLSYFQKLAKKELEEKNIKWRNVPVVIGCKKPMLAYV